MKHLRLLKLSFPQLLNSQFAYQVSLRKNKIFIAFYKPFSSKVAFLYFLIIEVYLIYLLNWGNYSTIHSFLLSRLCHYEVGMIWNNSCIGDTRWKMNLINEFISLVTWLSLETVSGLQITYQSGGKNDVVIHCLL